MVTVQYFYAGRHVVPGLEGLSLECTSDVNRVWSPLSVPRWSSTARLITKYLVNMIKVSAQIKMGIIKIESQC